MGRGEDGAETTSSRHVPLPATRWDGGPAGVDSHRLSVAPMLDCTDSHFRRLCRLLSKRTHLWSEMVNQDAVLYAHKTRPALLSHGTEEHPVTCQLGGAKSIPTRPGESNRGGRVRVRRGELELRVSQREGT